MLPIARYNPIILRLLFTILALVSLIGFLAVGGVAVYGQFIADTTFGPQNEHVTWRFSWRNRQLSTYVSPSYVTRYSLYSPPWQFAGVTFTRGPSPNGIPIVAASMPQSYVWIAALLLSLAPALWTRSFLRARHARPSNLCSRCGYDLRATPDRCPECGEAPAEVTHSMTAAQAGS